MVRVKVQEVKERYSITIPKVICEAMSYKKGDKLMFKWNGNSFELRRETREEAERIKKARKKQWENIEYKEKRLKAMFKGLLKRPTSFEQRIIDLISEYNLPYKYVGDGQIWIVGRNPDFIETNGKKVLIEVYNKFHHPINYEELRTKHFTKYGFKTIFLSEDDLFCNDWKGVCLEKMRGEKP